MSDLNFASVREMPMQYRVQDGWEGLPSNLSHREVSGVAVDSSDRVYLLCRSPEMVLVYASNGEFIESWGHGIFTRPHAITIGPDNRIYIADDGSHLIHIFSPKGEPIGRIGTGEPSDTGFDESLLPDYETALGRVSGGPPFNRPTKVAISSNGHLYISDGYRNCRIHHFAPDRVLIHSWGTSGIAPGEFHLPHSVSIHPDGRLFVSDRENDRLQLFTPEGQYIGNWDHIRRPCDVAFDSQGNVYVAELGRGPQDLKSWVHGKPTEELPSRISVLDSGGNFITCFGDAAPSYAPGNLVAPHAIAVDSRGDVYVGEVPFAFRGATGTVPEDCHAIQKFVRQ